MAIIGILLAILPFLAPLAIILMIILFITRIGYVKANWRPIVGGLLLYGSAFPLLARTQSFYFMGGTIIEPILMGVFGAFLLHVMMKWIYSHGYSASRAFGIMGSVPVVIVAFILPFLKLHIPVVEGGADVFVSESKAPVGNVSGDLVVHQTQNVSSEPSLRTIQSGVTAEVAPTTEPIFRPMTQAPPIMEGIPHYVHASDPVTVAKPVHETQTITEQTNSGPKTYRMQSNIFGGQDMYDSQGSKVISTHENIFDGQDYYTPLGEKIASNQPNVVDGSNIYDDGQLKYSTQPNVFGGENIYDAHNQIVLETRDNGIGGKDIFDKHGNKVGTVSN